MTTFTLNGAAVEVPDDRAHLLVALREDLGIISAKDGCAPSGQCGCCTVLLDGKAVVACQVSLEKVAGREVVTLEGIEERFDVEVVSSPSGVTHLTFARR